MENILYKISIPIWIKLDINENNDIFTSHGDDVIPEGLKHIYICVYWSVCDLKPCFVRLCHTYISYVFKKR